jgi:diketogulonate reductase-like aldo/keto reductase
VTHATGDAGPVKDLGDGVLMPVLGLGVWQIPRGRATQHAVEWALEAGYRHLDTATVYRNERDVGAALARSGVPREQVFVTTKWFPVLRSPARELAASLDRLGLERVDLYLIHWPLPPRSTWAWRELETLRERGLTRAIGVSNYGARRLARLTSGTGIRPAVDQVELSPLHFRPEILDQCRREGIVVEAYSPLARGRGFADPVIATIAERIERPAAQVMLRWAVQHGAVVIPKSSRRDRIRSNARIFDFELDAADMQALDGLDRHARPRR